MVLEQEEAALGIGHSDTNLQSAKTISQNRNIEVTKVVSESEAFDNNQVVSLKEKTTRTTQFLKELKVLSNICQEHPTDNVDRDENMTKERQVIQIPGVPKKSGFFFKR